MCAKLASETARERELFKYFQPGDVLPGEPLEHRPLRSSHDTALTAFAQLGALRLQVKRGLISFVSRKAHYIIAEATSTMSLQCDDTHDLHDELIYGVGTFPRTYGVSAHAFDLFFSNKSNSKDAIVKRDSDGSVTHYVVPDVQANDGLAQLSETSGMGFYAAVPLRTKLGFLIGTYSIADNTSGKCLSDAEVVFMTDVASTIMDHLEYMRVKAQHYRSDCMVKGIGVFTEGGASIRDWWLRTGHHTSYSTRSNKLDIRSLDVQANDQFGTQEQTGSRAVDSDDEEIGGFRKFSSRPPQRPSLYTTSGEPSEYSESVFSKDSKGVISSLTTNLDPKLIGISSKPQNEVHEQKDREDIVASEQDTLPLKSTDPDAKSGSQLQAALLSYDIKDVFSRASNLIREAVSTDGALYLDASIGASGRSSRAVNITHVAPTAFKYQSSTTPWTTVSTSSDTDQQNEAVSPDSTSTKFCGVLGFSTRQRSSFKQHEPSRQHTTVPETFLQGLLKRYPHGKLFNLDENNLISSSEDETDKVPQGIPVIEQGVMGSISQSGRRKKRKKTREEEGIKLLEIFPGARSIAFFPLWDSHKERWFAGNIIWTTSATRVLDPAEDLTYLAAFGNSIMAEVSRLEATIASQSRESFMSSISHELRSPLHGAQGTLEMLQDTTLDLSQIDMVQTIDACAKTLLDTIDHVLDFSSINANSRKEAGISPKENSRRRRRKRQGKIAADTVVPTVDIALLTEEVVQGIYAGHMYHKPESLENDGRSPAFSNAAQRTPGDTRVHHDAVIVIVDIGFRNSWNFPIVAGAWRRLVMNLFANALKYTQTGFIQLSLQSNNRMDSADDSKDTTVALAVRDTGTGISEEYLKNHLFTPFSQEHALSPGTGLGLSIVQNIVDGIGGSIQVNSEQGVGTDIIVSIPYRTSSLSRNPTSKPAATALTSVRERTEKLSAGLIGFDVYPDLPTGILSVDAQRMFALRSALRSILTEWFGIDVYFAPTIHYTLRNMHLTTELTYSKMDSNLLGIDSIESSQENGHSLIIVLSTKPCQTGIFSLRGQFIVTYMEQPLGPHKLAKILENWLERRMMPWPVDPVLLPKMPKIITEGTDTASDTGITSPLSLELGDQTQVTIDQAKLKRVSLQVLLVEDNAINMKLLSAYMLKLGLSYHTAVNGQEALDIYQKPGANFDVIFMDISMPIMDGITSSRHIRRHELKSGMPPVTIIALTGAASPAARQEAFSSGIDQYLVKPVSIKSLKTILDNLIDVKEIKWQGSSKVHFELG